jgi:hypothetical protein
LGDSLQAKQPGGERALDLSPLDAVIARMEAALEEHHRQRDGREVFLFAYRFLTEEMRRNLLAGRFVDPQWMIALAGRFADLYFEANAAFERGDPACPAPWEIFFRVARTWRATSAEILLLGMNAHIVHDLPLALSEPLRLERGAHQTLRKFDHEMVNEILEESIDPFQAIFAARFGWWWRVADELAWRLDEWLSDRMLRMTREHVWAHAIALAEARDPLERQSVYRHIVVKSMRNARNIDLINSLPGPARRLLRRLRPEF